MMTNTTYEALLGGALAQVEKLRAIGVGSEDIVFVMTEDIYRFANTIDANFATSYQVEALTIKAKLYGYDVGVINGPAGETTETIFTAASKGIVYHVGMEVGDMIVVDEDDGEQHLYSFDLRPTVCFLDTGRTVRFEMTGAVNDAFWDFGPYRFDGPAPSWDSGFVVPPVYRFGDYAEHLDSLTRAAATTPPLDVNWEEILETIRQGSPADWLHPRRTATPKKQKSKPKESKLTPEDTKELDDFLNSFVVKPAT